MPCAAALSKAADFVFTRIATLNRTGGTYVGLFPRSSFQPFAINKENKEIP